MAEIPEEFTETYGFHLDSHKDGVKLFEKPVDFDNDRAAHSPLSLLAVGNLKKVYIASNFSQVVIGHVETLEEDRKYFDIGQTTIVAISADNEHVFVVTEGTLKRAPTDELFQGKETFNELQKNVKNFKTSPTVPDLSAALLDSGVLSILKGDQIVHSLDNVDCFSWDLDGTTIGTAIGAEFAVYKPDGTKVSSYTSDEKINDLVSLQSGQWLLQSNPPDEDPIYKLLVNDAGSFNTLEVPLAPPFGEVERVQQMYFSHLQNWINGTTMTLVSTSLATEIASFETKGGQTKLMAHANDTDRAELPVDDKSGDDTLPVGMAVDVTGTSRVVKEPCLGVEEANGVLPRLFCLNHLGHLVVWDVFESHHILNDGLSLERALPQLKSVEVSPAKSESASLGAFSAPAKVDPVTKGPFSAPPIAELKAEQSKPAAPPASPYKSTIGSTPSSGFGQLGFGANLSGGFGQSGFGQSGFGQSGFGQSGFGQKSETQKSSEVKSGFGSYASKGTESKSSPFGNTSASNDIFGDSSNAKPFGSTTESKSIFGDSSNAKPFGSTTETKSIFGASLETKPIGSSLETKPFGSSSETKPFGSTSETKPFGSSEKKSIFGNPTDAKPFGLSSQTSSAFGTPSSAQPFGSSSDSKPFGQPALPGASPTPSSSDLVPSQPKSSFIVSSESESEDSASNSDTSSEEKPGFEASQKPFGFGLKPSLGSVAASSPISQLGDQKQTEESQSAKHADLSSGLNKLSVNQSEKESSASESEGQASSSGSESEASASSIGKPSADKEISSKLSPFGKLASRQLESSSGVNESKLHDRETTGFGGFFKPGLTETSNEKPGFFGQQSSEKPSHFPSLSGQEKTQEEDISSGVDHEVNSKIAETRSKGPERVPQRSSPFDVLKKSSVSTSESEKAAPLPPKHVEGLEESLTRDQLAEGSKKSVEPERGLLELLTIDMSGSQSGASKDSLAEKPSSSIKSQPADTPEASEESSSPEILPSSESRSVTPAGNEEVAERPVSEGSVPPTKDSSVSKAPATAPLSIGKALLSVKESTPDEFDDAPPLDEVEIRVFGQLGKGENTGTKVEQEMRLVLQTTEAISKVFRLNAKKVNDRIRALDYDKDPTDYRRLGTAKVIRAEAEKKTPEAQLILKVARDLNARMEEVMDLANQSEEKRKSCERLVLQVAKFEKSLSSENVKDRPLEIRGEMLKLRLREKLRKIESLYEEALEKLVPLSLEQSSDSSLVEKLEEAAFEISAKLHRHLKDIARIEEDINELQGIKLLTDGKVQRTVALRSLGESKWAWARQLANTTVVEDLL